MASEDNRLPPQFDVVIERDDEGYYVASVPQLPGCHTQARSLDDVTERIREAIELYIEDCLDAGDPVPQEAGREFVEVEIAT